MNLQLADGSLENPMGLLERVIVNSCGLEYEHTFAIVDFGRNTNYEVILGRPFMRQFRMIQGWGYNYLYLRHESAVTRVNLRNHRYRDVTKSPVEEFDSGSSDEIESTLSVDKAGLWVCGTSCKNLKPEDVVIDRSVTDEAYVPLPFPEHLIDPQEWIHALATLSICALPKPTQFCDSDGYDIIPIRMISLVRNINEENEKKCLKEQVQFQTDTVSVRELSSQDYGSADEGDNDGCLDMSEDLDSRGDDIVPESEIEKVRLLLREREVLLDIPYDKPKQKFCKSHRKFRKQALKEKLRTRKEKEDVDKEHFIPPPNFSRKNKYLYYVGAEDGVKDEVKWRYGFQLVQKTNEKGETNPKKQKKKRKPKSQESVSTKKTEQGSLSKIEQRALWQERKRTLKAVWSSMSDDSEEGEDTTNVPSNFKKFTIQNRKIIFATTDERKIRRAKCVI